jgi:Tol biopolymer transport system component
VAFASNRAHYEGATPEPGAPDFDLYVVNADGTGLSRVTSAPANEQDPSWAPDGASLYYWSDEGSRGDLYRVWIGTGRVERLTRQFVGRALMPSASPDGTRVAFAAQTLRLGQFWAYQVHLLDVARGTTAALAASSGACWPAWSPDGARLAHVRLAEGRPSALEIRTLATGASSALVDDPVTWSYYPAWSRDGRFVAFSTSPAHHEGEDWDLAVVEVATRRVTRLTTGRGNDRLPDWKP